MDGLSKRFRYAERQREEDFSAEKALVATTATDAADKVYVTLPNSEAPQLRIQVEWRLGVMEVDGTVQARYPQRGNRGIVIYDDEGEAWLIY